MLQSLVSICSMTGGRLTTQSSQSFRRPAGRAATSRSQRVPVMALGTLEKLLGSPLLLDGLSEHLIEPTTSSKTAGHRFWCHWEATMVEGRALGSCRGLKLTEKTTQEE